MKEHLTIEDARQEVYFFNKRHGEISIKISIVEFSLGDTMYWFTKCSDIMFKEIWERIRKSI